MLKWIFGAPKIPTTERRQDDDLTKRVETLERRWKELEAEWDGWYDKYRRLYARLSKREERAHLAPDDPVEPQTTPEHRETRTVRNPAARRLLGLRD